MKYLDGFKMLPLQMKYAMNLEQHTSADYDPKSELLQNCILHVRLSKNRFDKRFSIQGKLIF